MKGERLFRILGLIDEDLIDEAAPTAAVSRRKPVWRKALAAAACLTLVCGLSLAWLVTGGFRGMGSSAPGDSSGSSSGGGSGHEEGTAFMSYAGPVFPLTLAEESEGLTAERTITWDFAPETLDDGSSCQWGAAVTDSYVLVNHTTEDITAVAYYPFAGSFRDLASQRPTAAVDVMEAETALYAGSYAGGFQGVWQSDGQGGYVLDGTTLNLESPDEWTDYRALLEDGGYLARALGDAQALDIPVTVYEFTDFAAPADYDAATQAIEFTIDQNKTTVLTYGFSGASWDGDTGWRQYSYFVPNGQRRDTGPKLLVVLGEDIGNYTLGGYENGACEKELAGVSCTVIRQEATLDEVLDRLCRSYLETYAEWQWSMEDGAVDAVPFALFRRAVGELLVQHGVLAGDGGADRYSTGRLDDLISEAVSQRRVLYLAVDVTVPAGSSVDITFELWKEPSYDFYCSGSENTGLQGYDLVTALGSGLDFTAQTAALAHTDGMEIVRQNFGFDLENGVTEVALDPAEEHYYLEIRSLG